MTDYNSSNWADEAFASFYTTKADDIILERRRMIGILMSYYAHYFGNRKQLDILDLGCGDGAITAELMKNFNNATATLLDGSEDMLAKARVNVPGASFRHVTFQNLLAGEKILTNYDFIFSSLAIHHMNTGAKVELYSLIHHYLNDDGRFVNIDVVLPPSDDVEGWYMDTWKRWVDGRDVEQGKDIIQRYKGNADNVPDSLDIQLTALKYLGFKDVDCYYKNGIFAIFGGRK